MGCANTKSTKKSQQKSQKSQRTGEQILSKQMPASQIAPISNVDSKFCSKIVQQPNSQMQKNILAGSMASNVLSSQIQPSQFDSKYDGGSVVSTLSSQGGSSVLGSQLNPSDYQSSALGGSVIGSSGVGSSAISSSGGSTPYSTISQTGGSSLSGASYGGSSFAPGSSYAGSNVSAYSNMSNVKGSSAISGVSKPGSPRDKKGQKLYTPSQIFTKFLDEKKGGKHKPKTAKQQIAKFSKV
ncbi:hypothetical protein DERP_000718, partial [Dermatophagoides pteronyssinus]